MPLLEFTSKGIYCKQAKVYLDPWRGVERALISHGHSDHARWGSKHYITQKINVPIIKHRLGNISVSGKKYNDVFRINGVQFSFHPAGHVPGSSQIRVEYKGEVWVFTGDYKIQNDLLFNREQFRAAKKTQKDERTHSCQSGFRAIQPVGVT